ncbi:MAG: hypothetical protein RIC55_35855 [Pirellulaceae bacterium]
MHRCRQLRTLLAPFLVAPCLLLALGCAAEPLAGEKLDGVVRNFDIYWPPRDPEEIAETSARPLLRGAVALEERPDASGGCELQLAVTITRPSEESDRQFWNTQLAYADLAWMDEVRVWDADAQWLWPNLPFLLRRPGLERVERYGGVDPGKHVDNDFAAVLIRKYDARGAVESPDTREAPLVSADWRAEGLASTDVHTIVHVAKSDTFLVHLGDGRQPARGQLKVWLIYADFLGSPPPRTWPKQREWAGGILAYCEIDWEQVPGQACRGIVRHKRPEEGTRFPWKEWASGGPRTAAQSRLTDRGD